MYPYLTPHRAPRLPPRRRSDHGRLPGRERATGITPRSAAATDLGWKEWLARRDRIVRQFRASDAGVLGAREVRRANQVAFHGRWRADPHRIVATPLPPLCGLWRVRRTTGHLARPPPGVSLLGRHGTATPQAKAPRFPNLRTSGGGIPHGPALAPLLAGRCDSELVHRPGAEGP